MTTIVGFDLETYLIRPGWNAPKPVVSCYAKMVIGEKRQECHLITPEAMVGVLKEVSEDSDSILLAHNLPFDCSVMMEWFPETIPYIFKIYEEGRVTDTIIREKLRKCALGRLQFDHTRGNRKPGFRLADLVLEYMGLDISAEKTDPEAWRMRYAELDGIPFSKWPQPAIDYCYHDVELMLDIFDHQIAAKPSAPRNGLPLLDDTGWRFKDEVRQTRSHLILTLKNSWGLRTDAETGREIEKEWDTRIKEGKARYPQFYKKRGVKDMAALRAAVEKAYESTERKVPQTDGGKDGLNKQTSTKRLNLELSQNEELIGFAAVMKADSYRSKFLKVMVSGVHFPIHAFYDPVLASGRVSLTKGLHQLPRKERVREAFKPREGYVYIASDYTSVEMCTLAQHCIDICGESKLAEAINAGKDPHLNMAAAIKGITYEEAMVLKKAGNKEILELRQHSKPANFGYPGGMGPKAFVEYALGYGVTIDIPGAARLKKMLLETAPELVNHFAFVNQQVKVNGDFTQVIKRSTRQRGKVGYCDALNGYFQSPAADGMKAALWKIGYECYNVPSSPLYGCRGGISMHDEEMLECPIEQAPEAADRLAEIMIQEMQPITPDVIIRSEPVMMERWYKDAETVRDKNGRLQLWKPDM